MESGIEGWMSVKEMMPDPDAYTITLREEVARQIERLTKLKK